MGIRVSGVVIDATDLELFADFWRRLLELEVIRHEAVWISLGPHLALQRVPEPLAVEPAMLATNVRVVALGGYPTGRRTTWSAR